jgi:uncharacterized protein (TIGR03435 family)
MRLRLALGGFLLVAMSLAQSQPEPLEFEAASIRPVSPAEAGARSGCIETTGLLRCVNVTLKRCIVGSYGLGPDRILGGPDWLDTDRFRITGRSSKPVGDSGLMAMLRALLADRFRLALHHEFRTGEAMVLEVAGKGPKLHPAVDAHHSWGNMHDHLEAKNVGMEEFAAILSRNLSLPVVDQTGLSGAFSFTLRWNPDTADSLQGNEAVEALRSEVSGAVRRQLGLTLKYRKMPVEMLVIDHAEKPSAD